MAGFLHLACCRVGTLQIDPQQLEFMDAVPDPEVLEFEIEALADGDYKENLNITLRSKATE